MSDSLRARTGSSESPSTYTPDSMESGAMVSHHAPIGDPVETDPRMAMALLSAHEQERSRLAEELHDGTAQGLANAIFQTEITDRALRDDPSLALEELHSLRRMLERELDTLRGYINQLRPSLGEAGDLDDALSESAGATSQRMGVPIELHLDASSARLHEAAKTVALRVAQEALRNIAKHSDARRAWITTSSQDAAQGQLWVLEVGDDGRGFDYEAVASNPNRRHFGLRFMRERAHLLLGSQLSIQTGPAAGTVVRLTIDPGEETR